MRRVAAMLLWVVMNACEPLPPTCGRCESVVREEPDQPPRLIAGQCRINGVPIDCRTSHPACPDCAAKK